MLAGIPLPLPEQFQPGAVQHEVDGTTSYWNAWLSAGERPVTPAQGTARPNPSKGMTLRVNASAWRRAKWKTRRRVSTSSTTRSE